MNLPERLHCPRCKGRLTLIAATAANGSSDGSLHCTSCEWTGPVTDNIADLIGERLLLDADPHRISGNRSLGDAAADDLLTRLRAAAGDCWPGSLGEVLEIGCGTGKITAALASGTQGPVRGLFAIDSDRDMLRACGARFALLESEAACPTLFARVSLEENSIRDAIADTVISVAALQSIGDVQDFLAAVHRILRPGGRAYFVAPNRRYYQAVCRATADAMVHMFAHDGKWPEQAAGVFSLLATLRRRLLHQGDQSFLSTLHEKHLFDTDFLEDTARELGFAGVRLVPMDPDPLGGETAQRLLLQAEVPDTLVAEVAPLVASIGAPYFSLLARQDCSASMLFYLTKGVGPGLRTFTPPPVPTTVPFGGPETALGGAPPRWHVQLSASDTAAGIVLSVSGWVLLNADVLWLRLRLDGVIKELAVWRARPDVHEVLNGRGLYQALNAICSGVDVELLFEGLHPIEDRCQLQLEVVVANGVIARGRAPDTLVMDERLVVQQ